MSRRVRRIDGVTVVSSVPRRELAGDPLVTKVMSMLESVEGNCGRRV